MTCRSVRGGRKTAGSKTCRRVLRLTTCMVADRLRVRACMVAHDAPEPQENQGFQGVRLIAHMVTPGNAK